MHLCNKSEGGRAIQLCVIRRACLDLVTALWARWPHFRAVKMDALAVRGDGFILITAHHKWRADSQAWIGKPRAVRSVLSEEKKLSIAALSQTLPDRLIEQVMP